MSSTQAFSHSRHPAKPQPPQAKLKAATTMRPAVLPESKPEPAPPSTTSSPPRRKRGRTTCQLPVLAVSWAVLCNSLCRCEALSSVAGRKAFAQSRALRENGAAGRRNHGATTSGEPSIFHSTRRHNSSFDHAFGERMQSSPEETNCHRGRREWMGKRRRRLGRCLGHLRSKISRRRRAADDTFHSGSGRATRRASSPSWGHSSPSNNPTTFSPAASRLARVLTFASSSSLTSTLPSTSSTALHMVLSTPDTIIEQASTQGLLDTLLDESVRTQSRQPIMIQFNPKRGWLWRQWRGTVFSETWKSGLLNMAIATCVVFLYRLYPGLKDLLQGFSILWGQLLSVTTFTLTFFLNQSYGLWRKCYDYSRRLQGRLNDLGMTLAAHAARDRPSLSDTPSTYTQQSRQALELVSRYVRVFNLLTYASFTRSHRPILTPRGMRRLVERGILTPREHEILADAQVPATQRHNAVLIWLMRLLVEGMQAGVFEGGSGFEQQFMEKCHVIRAQYGAIGDELQGRMPLAYAHIVQVLLDVVLWMYPFMALSTGMAWYIGILGTGLLTMFYQGLFDLAKRFLDPYDNENYGKGDDPLVIDTLIAETNAGSVRWLNSFQQQPWNRQLLNDGELYDSILPLRGYSTEDLAEKEAQDEKERLEREAAKEEKKRREDEMDRRRAEELLLKHVANAGNGTSTSAVGEKMDDGTAVMSPAGEVLMGGFEERGVNGDKILMEVSGGEVVATSSLLPSNDAVDDEKDSLGELSSFEVDANATVEMENKVLTLADGTLVTADDITSDDSLTMNVTENTTVSFQAAEDAEDAKEPSSEDGAAMGNTAEDTPPRLLDEANEVPWGQLGKTPNFDESIAEMEAYKESAPLTYMESPSVPSVPLYDTEYDTGTATKFDEDVNGQDLDNEDIFEPMTIEWFDEVGPDGNEYRLSQMLADEVWSEEEEDGTDRSLSDFPSSNDPFRNKTMTYEEFEQKATAMMERVENELAETKEILSVLPGSSAEMDMKSNRDISMDPAPSIPTRRSKTLEEPSTELMYDQTQLDGISQLWGAPPDVLEKSLESESDEMINDGNDFGNVYALWGESAESGMSDEEEDSTISTSVEGFTQLWNEDLAPFDPGELNVGFRDSSVDPLLNANDLKAFAGVEWWDEISDDGSFKSLSQMLADEEYEEMMEEEAEAPMTFEQFAEETEKLIEEAEHEREETEAIMNAPAFASFLKKDDEDPDAASAVEKSVVTSDRFKELVKTLNENEAEDAEEEEEEIISDEEIGVLEMDDVPEDEEINANGDDGEVDEDSSLQINPLD